MQALLPLFLFVAPPRADHEQAAAELQAAVENSTDEDRDAAIEALANAITLQSQYPDQTSANVPEHVLEARVILVRLYLAENNPEAAQAAMDDLIRTARGQTPPVRSYGAEVTELYQVRKDALQAGGMATLEFACEAGCEITVNERQITADSEKLFLGRYRVWIKASERADWEYQEVELDEPDSTKTIISADPNPAEAAPEPQAPKQRMLPRTAEIVGIATGVGLVIAGAVMLSFDGKCNKSKQVPTVDTTMEECGNILETTAGGASLVGIGGGLLVISGVMLSIDEVRVGRAKGQQVMVGVTLRF